jgi:glycosyltransferase involved in cell wall biosynthesis
LLIERRAEIKGRDLAGNMKIAYICFHLAKGMTGPIESLKQRAIAARKNRLDIDFYILNKGRDFHDRNFHLVKVDKLFYPVMFYKKTFNKFSFIEENVRLDNYDFVVLRYLFADKSGIEFAKKYPLVTEHHTDTLSEMRNLIDACPLPARRLVWRLKRNILEKRYGHRMLARCRGMISVTDEIAEAQAARSGSSIPSVTIPNGIGVDNVKPTGFRPFEGKSLDMIFVTSTLFPWNGFERIVPSLNNYRGNVDIKLHVVGDVDRVDFFRLYGHCDRIKFHGLMNRSDLDCMMGEMNLAVGTMALYKNKMQQACSLKTREYVARGIPFIIAHDDPDLNGIDPQRRFFESYPNDSSPIDVGTVIEFAERVSENRDEVIAYMRRFAAENLDWSVKMLKLYDFVANITLRDKIREKGVFIPMEEKEGIKPVLS